MAQFVVVYEDQLSFVWLQDIGLTEKAEQPILVVRHHESLGIGIGNASIQVLKRLVRLWWRCRIQLV